MFTGAMSDGGEWKDSRGTAPRAPGGGSGRGGAEKRGSDRRQETAGQDFRARRTRASFPVHGAHDARMWFAISAGAAPVGGPESRLYREATGGRRDGQVCTLAIAASVTRACGAAGARCDRRHSEPHVMQRMPLHIGHEGGDLRLRLRKRLEDGTIRTEASERSVWPSRFGGDHAHRALHVP